ncbi:MAG: glycoside hydrolase family 3 C-terminal domain-containing protein [Phototrophicaceae bacterium]|jgi:beta-glucosidase
MILDIEALLTQLTLEEKAALCTGATAWTTVAVDRLGIPAIWVADGPHGLRRTETIASRTSLPATCFPTASALSATWNTDLIRDLGEALATECLVLGVDVLLGPGVNMKRTPLCGRNFEYFSEDPYLAGTLATAFIQAVQSKGVGTSLKHYAANNQETNRMSVSAEIDERTLREIYLPAFEMAVKQAQPYTVMCAYNRVNGVYASEHHALLTEILKDEWGFDGVVVSDWGAVHDRVVSLQAGLDFEMPGNRPDRVQSVIDAVNNGQLEMSVLDAAVRRMLRLVKRAQVTPKGGGQIPVDAHHALARQIAAEAIVLLQNSDDILPLKSGQSLAVIGLAAQVPVYQGSGSSKINPTRLDIPLEEIRKLAGYATVSYAEGYTALDELHPALIDDAVILAQAHDVALLFVDLPESKASEGIDRPDLRLSAQQILLIQAVCDAQPNTVVILNTGSAVDMLDWVDLPAGVVQAWLSGQASGGAIADVLFGVVNPSGRLAETFPLQLEDTPAYINFPGDNDLVRYGEGVFIGYRYYDTRRQEVLFPFGFGLSYTRFEYSNLKLSRTKITDQDTLTVSVDVRNSGGVAGKTVVQVYVRDDESSLQRPMKELQGFAKTVLLQPEQTQTVTITLAPRAFQMYDPAWGAWRTESGSFSIMVGESVADIRQRASIQVESTQKPPCLVHRYSTLAQWQQDPYGAPVMEAVLDEFRKNLPGAEDGGAWHGMEMMPAVVLFGFFGADHLPKPPDQLIDDLVAQAHALAQT